MPQSEDVDWNFPVLVETVVMMGRYGHMNFLRMPSRADRYKVDQALERVGMSAFRHRQIGELSGGQKKRVFLARSLAQEGRIILLDEPFTGIDVKTEAAIIGLLRELRAAGHLMLVSTHNLGSVPEFCDQVVLINRTVLASGPTARSLHAGKSRARLRRRAAQLPARRPRAARRRRHQAGHGAHRRRAAGGVLWRSGRLPQQDEAGVTWTPFFAELLVPFSYDYMLKAMWVSALVGGVCAFLSAYLMLKGWSLMGDALAHSIVPGVAAAYIVGAPFAVGAFFAGILAAGGMQFVKLNSRLREDAVIGLVFTTLFALGLLMASIWPTSVSIQTIVLGNILAISDEDVVQVAIIAAVSLAILAVLWKDLMVTFFDENHARSIGLNTRALKIVFFTLLSACTVAALQTVGACLVIAMVVTPGATAYLLTDRFGRLILISVALGMVTSFAGAYISFFLDGATGGVIVTLQTLLFIAAFYFAPKHGVIAARRRRLAVVEAEA